MKDEAIKMTQNIGRLSQKIRTGNKDVGRKLYQLRDEFGLSTDVETIRFCIHKVWKEIIEQKLKEVDKKMRQSK